MNKTIKIRPITLYVLIFMLFMFTGFSEIKFAQTYTFNNADREIIRFLYPDYQIKKEKIILEIKDGKPQYLVSSEIKKWSHTRHLFVALVITSTNPVARFFDMLDTSILGPKEISGKRIIYIIKKTKNKLNNIANLEADICFYCAEDQVKYHFLKLDLANYKISNSISAIGLRSGSTYNVRYNEDLSLYIIKNKSLHKIFNDYIAFSDRFREYESILIFSTKKTHGYYDIIRKTTSLPIMSDKPPEKKMYKNYFKWDSRYQKYTRSSG